MRKLLVPFILLANVGVAAAQTFSVTNANASGAGSLSQAITSANAFGGAATINLNSGLNITLTGELPILKNPSGITINGNGSIINGGSTSNTTGFRVFFIGVGGGEAAVSPGLSATTSTNWAINNLTIQNANARGGNGAGGGGGGAGLGGGIFVNAGALTLSGVSFVSNLAIGGSGGTGGAGSGGGMGGNATINGSAGGFGIGADGGALGVAGGTGSFTGGAAGHAGFGGGAAGGPDGGGGGGAGSISFAGSPGGVGPVGSNGGFGGGGGAFGNGGFGGGSGAGNNILNGGFGGGGSTGTSASSGIGGFGAGNRAGGGLGAGAAVFVRQGASLALLDGAITGGTVQGGTGGNNLGHNGQGIGSGLFLAGSATYTVSSGNTVTIANSLGGGVDSQITGGFTKSGPGTLVLTGGTPNGHTGTTTVAAGTLVLSKTDLGSATNFGSAMGDNLAINSGATARYGAWSQVRDDKSITVAGTIDFNNNAESILHLNVNGGSVVGASGGTFVQLFGDINADASATSSIAGRVLLSASAPNAAKTVTVAGGGVLTVSADMENGANGNAAQLVKAGPGTLVLTGGNTYTGGTTVNAGTLALNRDGALTTVALAANGGPITVNAGATLRFDSNNALGFQTATGASVVVNGGTVTNAGGNYNQIVDLTLNGGTLTGAGGFPGFGSYAVRNTLTSTGASQIVLGTANNGYLALSPAGTTTFQVTSGTLTVNATIANNAGTGGGVTGTLVKTGAGTLLLNGTNTFTGGATVSSGTLRGTGSLATAVTVASGARLHAGDGAAGNLTLNGGLTMSGGAVLGTTLTNSTTGTKLVKTGGPGPTGLGTMNLYVDLNSISLTVGQHYDFVIAQGMGDQSALSINDPTRFTFANGTGLYNLDTPTLTGVSNGNLVLGFNVIPVPEPAFLGLLLPLAFLRRRLTNIRSRGR